MDEPRQNIQIRERAGLEEARLNQDFIEFLTRWSTPLLVIIAVGVCGNYLYQQYTKKRDEKIGRAFEQLALVGAVAEPNPESLRLVAVEFDGVGSVAELARLKAGDAYMRAVMRGVKPGSEVNPDGTTKNVSDELTPEDREDFLKLAAEQYKLVAESTATKKGQETLHVGALFGLAAVAESRGDAAGAKAEYEKIKSATAGIPDLKEFGAIASKRIEDLPKVLAVSKLPTKATLPAPTKEDEKAPLPGNIQQPGPAATDPLSSPGLPGSSPVGPMPPAPSTDAKPEPKPADPQPAAPAPTPAPSSTPAPASPK